MKASVQVGDLVYIKDEGTKHSPRERYIIIKITNQDAILQKMNGSKLMSKRYEVPLTRIFPVIAKLTEHITSQSVEEESSDDDPIPSSVDDLVVADESEEHEIQENSSESDRDQNGAHDSENDSDDDISDNDSDSDINNYPTRNRREPAWLREDIWQR